MGWVRAGGGDEGRDKGGGGAWGGDEGGCGAWVERGGGGAVRGEGGGVRCQERRTMPRVRFSGVVTSATMATASWTRARVLPPMIRASTK